MNSATTSTDRFVDVLRKLRGNGVSAALLRGGSSAFIIKLLATGVAFVSYIVLARLLNVESFGNFVFVSGWLTVLLCFTKLGLDTAFLRFIPTYQASKDWPRYRGFTSFATRVSTGMSTIAGILMAGAAWVLRDTIGEELLFTFLVAAVVMVGRTALTMWAFHLQALREITKAHAPLHVGRPLVVVGGTATVWLFLRDGTGAHHAMAAELAAAASMGAVTLFMLLRTQAIPRGETDVLYETRSWLRVSLSFLLVSSMARLMTRFDILMLGSLHSTTDAGIYAAASEVSTLLLLGQMAANGIIAPMIAQFYSQGREDEMRRVLRLAAMGVTCFTLPVFLGLIALGPHLLGLFGGEFVHGNPALVILCAGHLINALSGPVVIVLTMTRHEKVAGRFLIVSGILNVTLNFILIPPLGMVGAALATAVTVGGVNLAMLAFIRKQLKIDPSLLCWLRR